MPLEKTGGLFSEEPGADGAPSSKVMTAHVDGGSRGNPGLPDMAHTSPTARASGWPSWANFSACRPTTLPNTRTDRGAGIAVEHGYGTVKVVSDSELLVKQMKGQYKVAARHCWRSMASQGAHPQAGSL